MICDFPDLFRLFSDNSADDIGKIQNYIDLCANNATNTQFQLQRGILEQVRRSLDAALAQQPTYKGQTRRAVILLEQNRRTAHFEWYYELIAFAFRPRWPEAQQEYFDRAARGLRKVICDFPELIPLFAAHGVRNIGGVAEYVELCRRHENNRQFQEQRNTVERIANALEELLDGQPNYQRQIREALIKLEKNRGLADFEWYYDMILQKYKRSWSEDQQEYFDRVVRTIRSGNEFFLSFTSRPPDTTTDKPVNRRYWYFIRSVIRMDNITKEDRRKRNLLADTVYTLLSDESFHGFYYKAHEGDNRQVMADLTEGCATSRVFIQLVQNVMFQVPPDAAVNYCEFEYRKANESIVIDSPGGPNPDNDERLIFVIAEEEGGFIGADRVSEPYSAWHADIMRKDHPYLPKVDIYDAARLSQVRETFDKIIVPQVRSAWKKVLDGIP